MKTPDEIKQGLEICGQAYSCLACPYKEEKASPYGCGDAKDADALAYIHQLEAQVPKWISVEERLPEGECLAGCFAPGSYGYGEYIIGYVAPYSESEGSGYCAENSFVVLDDITHWMPLPEAPKEDAEPITSGDPLPVCHGDCGALTAEDAWKRLLPDTPKEDDACPD